MGARRAPRAWRRSASRRSSAAWPSAASAAGRHGVRRAAPRARVARGRVAAAAGRGARRARRAAAGCAAPATWRSTRPTTPASGSRASSSTAQPIRDDARPCDLTRPVPCADGAAGAAFDTRDLGRRRPPAAARRAGRRRELDVGRADRARRQHRAGRAGGDAGRRRRLERRRARRIRMPVPGGQAAPLVRARVTACRAGGPCAEPAPGARRDGERGGRRAARPGEYSLRVALEDAAGNVGPSAPPVTLRFDDTRPGRARRLGRRPLAARRPLPLAAEGGPPVSGIRGFRVRTGGRDTVVATSLPLDALPEGATPIEVRTVSGAGVESGAVRTLVRLDRSRPAVEPPACRRRTPGRARPCGSASAAATSPVSRASPRSLGVDGGAEAAAGGDEAAVRRRGRRPPRGRLPGDRRRRQRLPARARSRSRSTARRPRRSRSRRRSGGSDRGARRGRGRDVGHRRRADRAAPGRRRGLAVRSNARRRAAGRPCSTTPRSAPARTSSGRWRRTSRATRRSAPRARTARRRR